MVKTKASPATPSGSGSSSTATTTRHRHRRPGLGTWGMASANPTLRRAKAGLSVADELKVGDDSTTGSGTSNTAVPVERRLPSKSPRARFAAPKSRLMTFAANIARQMSMTPVPSTESGTGDSHMSDIETGASSSSVHGATMGPPFPNADAGNRHGEYLTYGPERGEREPWSRSSASMRSAEPEKDAAGTTPMCPRRRRQARQNRRQSNASEEPAGPVNWLVVDNDFAAFTQPAFDPEEERQRVQKERQRDADIERAMINAAEVESAYNATPSHFSDGGSSRLRRRGGWGRRLWDAWLWLYHCVYHFVNSSFPDKQFERSFQKEASDQAWYASKPSAFIGSLFLLTQWVLSMSLATNMNTYGYTVYFGAAGLFTLPLPLLVLFDGQRRFKWIFQAWVGAATWVWGFIYTRQMTKCHFFGNNPTCTSNYLHLFAVLFGLPTMGIVALSQNRVIHIAVSLSWTITAGILFGKEPKTPNVMWRSVAIFQLYHLFLALNSYYRERSDRAFFTLRSQLKSQYKAVQTAQAMERRADQSKKRFVSYIFHEVRVPLNTARLAVTNLDSEGAFAQMHADQQDLILGLDGSLRMMEKVLNDMLSFNRMESGNLILARKPFDLHKSIHYVALSHRAIAELTGLDFELELDWRIDAMGSTVIGDEMRFKQVCSNLVSNAFKFTSEGGVRIVTKLVYPEVPEVADAGPHPVVVEKIVSDGEVVHPELTLPETVDAETPVVEESLEEQHQVDDEKGYVPIHEPPSPRSGTPVQESPNPSTPHVTYRPRPEYSKAVIRVEIHDTGAGISPSDVRHNRLFSPYVQTEIGRRQGGKGSGLGLALVMQIVKLSHGRLGVDSEQGKGSVFWFELPYSIPPPEARTTSPKFQPHVSPPDPQPSMSTSDSLEAPTPISPFSLSHGRMSTPSMGSHVSASPRNRSAAGSGTTDSHGDKRSRRLELRQQQRAMCQRRASPVSFNLPFAGSILPLDTETGLPHTDSPFSGAASAPMSPMSSISISGPPGGQHPAHRLPGFEQQHQSLAAATAASTMTPLSETPQGLALPASAVLPSSSAYYKHRRLSHASHTSSQHSASPLTVLVVDDDPLTRKLMARMLTRMGHDVAMAENGAIALQKIVASWKGEGEGAPVDVVFLDNQMPLMSGVEVAREVRRLGITVYIVGCTGNALREDQDEYLVAGADDIIPKPVAQTEIVAKLAEARRRKHGTPSSN